MGAEDFPKEQLRCIPLIRTGLQEKIPKESRPVKFPQQSREANGPLPKSLRPRAAGMFLLYAKNERWCICM
jgi:hypothetical protein